MHLRDATALKIGTPVVVDDILASGETFIQAIGLLRRFGTPTPVCIAVHAIFAEGSLEKFRLAGPTLVTANTIVWVETEPGARDEPSYGWMDIRLDASTGDGTCVLVS